MCPTSIPHPDFSPLDETDPWNFRRGLTGVGIRGHVVWYWHGMICAMWCRCGSWRRCGGDSSQYIPILCKCPHVNTLLLLYLDSYSRVILVVAGHHRIRISDPHALSGCLSPVLPPFVSSFYFQKKNPLCTYEHETRHARAQ